MSALVEDLRRFDPPWVKVGRLYRHICFLKTEGRMGDARRVEETELAAALAEAHQGPEPESEIQARFASLRDEAERRVAEAIAYAEVLVPMLADRLRGLPAPNAASPLSPPARSRVDAPGEARGIADFIDEMLAQDRVRSR